MIDNDLSSLTFSKETIKYMLFKLETKIQKIVEKIKEMEKQEYLHAFASDTIVYAREEDIQISVDIDVIEKLKYEITLRGFNPSGCKNYKTSIICVYDLEEVEKTVICLILDLILK